jgi:predicted  nucleic acid-binding Zn-ribbon protein
MNQSQILLFALASVPTMLTVLIGILINNSRLGDLNSRMGDLNSRMGDLNTRIDDTNSRIDDLRSHMDARFDDMRVTWQSELHRVEEVLDARLKHLEER